MYSIATSGALSQVPGSPFSGGPDGSPDGIKVTPDGKFLAVANVVTGTSASPDILWPPNHKFVDVAVNYTVTEPCPFTCTLTVSSNEPDEDEWNVVDAHEIQLRAERNGNGRVYTITITCTSDTNKKILERNRDGAGSARPGPSRITGPELAPKTLRRLLLK